ncbi:MAG: hypothetical protein HON90_18245 [Halobacteriovoraceae bacterium]|jgi:hypothetical protein|nr:hypothetical protein [Halobacteriovoraceae bacterium]
MKLLLVFSVFFTLLIDATSFAANHLLQDHNDNFMAESNHHSNGVTTVHEQSEDESESHDDCHTNCHIGHMHFAITPTTLVSNNLMGILNTKQYPNFRNCDIQEFHSKVIRPPIV